jgi:hypothetical protein
MMHSVLSMGHVPSVNYSVSNVVYHTAVIVWNLDGMNLET